MATLPRVIGINGWAETGKNAVADVLCDLWGYEVVHFADTLRRVALAINPIIGAHSIGGGSVRYADALAYFGYRALKDHPAYGPEVRRFLQALGTDAVRRHLGNDIWVDALVRNLDPHKGYVIPDTRFPNEAKAITEKLGGYLIRVNRPGYGPVNGHESETALDDWPFDSVIVNDGTLEDLAASVRKMMAVRFDR